MKLQTKWRITGITALIGAGFLALWGEGTFRGAVSPWFAAAYWGLFLVLLLVTLFCVWLDLRFIRLQYKIGQREIFEDTLGSEEFRRQLRERSRE